jgi:hypothetical protein
VAQRVISTSNVSHITSHMCAVQMLETYIHDAKKKARRDAADNPATRKITRELKVLRSGNISTVTVTRCTSASAIVLQSSLEACQDSARILDERFCA